MRTSTSISIGTILLTFSLHGYFCTMFREVLNARSKEFNMTVMKEVLTTAGECALLCLLSKTCLSFFHDRADGTCRLVAGTILESQMTPAVPSRPRMSYFISGDPYSLFCPLDFDKISIPGVCFKIIDTMMDNEPARNHCNGYSSGNMVGHLLTVYTMDMFDKLATILSAGEYHIDGYERLPDGAWVDWKGDELSVVRWDSGEPDNEYGHPDPTKQQCMFMTSNGTAHDIPCNADPVKILCQLEYVKRI